MTEILQRAFEATLAVRDGGDGRTLEGPLLPGASRPGCSTAAGGG